VRKQRNMSTSWKTRLRVSIAISVAAVMLLPFAYLLLGALASSFSLTGLIDLSVYRFTFANFSTLFGRAELYLPMINSIIVALAVTLGNLFFCTLCGYVLARRRFRAKGLLLASVIMVLMVPVHVVIIPMYLMTNWLGIFDTYLALILPFLVSPLGIFLMRQYISAIPPDMEDSARLEGAGELTIIWRVVMPLCKPALAVLAVQTFMVNWNSFIYPFILTSSESMRTLPVALALLQGYQNIDIPQLFAASVISVLPTTILFVVYSRRITEGIIAGALKG
jgi:multiple sugar transport system permease protein